MLSFVNEKYREAKPAEYFRVSLAVWALKPIRAGHFVSSLPFERVNEYRIMSGGCIVPIRF